ncbi:MAG: hypothetical protein K2X81_12600 [Candidatus Obscuribacterales bacterium]|nr:hypothetical protein [Candidatus Obscuribacterales bacterium]
MIRFEKPVKIMEWGLGTNTTNQKWTEIGEGSFTSRSVKDGITTMTIQLKGGIKRENSADDSVKLCQLGEGMAACSDKWGEVAIGHIQSVSGNTVVVVIPFATKISGAANALQKFFNLP